MTTPSPETPEARYAKLVESFLGTPGVGHAGDAAGTRRRFGASALKVEGKIFAMLVEGRLVVKLPRQRVDALVAAGDGARFEAGHGRAMKEWLALDPASGIDWGPLATEALAFVGPKR